MIQIPQLMLTYHKIASLWGFYRQRFRRKILIIFSTSALWICQVNFLRSSSDFPKNLTITLTTLWVTSTNWLASSKETRQYNSVQVSLVFSNLPSLSKTHKELSLEVLTLMELLVWYLRKTDSLLSMTIWSSNLLSSAESILALTLSFKFSLRRLSTALEKFPST